MNKCCDCLIIWCQRIHSCVHPTKQTPVFHVWNGNLRISWNQFCWMTSTKSEMFDHWSCLNTYLLILLVICLWIMFVNLVSFFVFVRLLVAWFITHATTTLNSPNSRESSLKTSSWKRFGRIGLDEWSAKAWADHVWGGVPRGPITLSDDDWGV